MESELITYMRKELQKQNFYGKTDQSILSIRKLVPHQENKFDREVGGLSFPAIN